MFRLVACVIVAVGGVVGMSSVSANQVPVDFAGNWVLDDASASPGPGSFCGRDCGIKQDGITLIVVTSRATEYRLDGIPVVSSVSTGRFKTEVSVTARWKGGRLVITRRVGDNAETTTTISLDNGKMIVEVAAGGPLGQEHKLVYSRKPPSSEKYRLL